MGRNVHLHSHPSRVEHWRHVVEIAAFIAAACWALYVFVYQERIKPESSPPRLHATFAIEQHQLRGARTFVKVNLELKNFGESVASLGVVNVNVYGVTYASKISAYTVAPAPAPSAVPGPIQLGHALAPGPERFLDTFTNVYGSFGAGKKFLNIGPNGSGDESFAFAVPAGNVDALLIRYKICWSHPTDHVFHEPLAQSPDGAYNFVSPTLLSDVNRKAGLLCETNFRGLPFAL